MPVIACLISLALVIPKTLLTVLPKFLKKDSNWSPKPKKLAIAEPKS